MYISAFFHHCFYFFNATSTTEIYTLSLHDALPISKVHVIAGGGSGELMMRALADAHIPFIAGALNIGDSDHTLRSEEHTSELQSHSDLVCRLLLEKKKYNKRKNNETNTINSTTTT